MSRSIDIGYEFKVEWRNRHIEVPRRTVIDVPSPYDLFGNEDPSKRFWNQPGLRKLGITRLAELGVGAPVVFHGWEAMDELGREIALYQEHFGDLESDAATKARWLAHLVYCYFLLVHTAPPDSIPFLTIG